MRLVTLPPESRDSSKSFTLKKFITGRSMQITSFNCRTYSWTKMLLTKLGVKSVKNEEINRILAIIRNYSVTDKVAAFGL